MVKWGYIKNETCSWNQLFPWLSWKVVCYTLVQLDPWVRNPMISFSDSFLSRPLPNLPWDLLQQLLNSKVKSTHKKHMKNLVHGSFCVKKCHENRYYQYSPGIFTWVIQIITYLGQLWTKSLATVTFAGFHGGGTCNHHQPQKYYLQKKNNQLSPNYLTTILFHNNYLLLEVENGLILNWRYASAWRS